MNFKAVLLDADGVVLKKAERFSAWYEREFDLPEGSLGAFFEKEFKACQLGQQDLKEAVKPYLAGWKWQDSAEEFLQLWFAKGSEVNEKVLNKAQEWRRAGVKCYLATNQEQRRLNYLRKELGLEKQLDGIFSSCEIGFAKPQKEFFQFILDEIKQLPTEVVLIDDSPQFVEGAKEMGMEAVLYEEDESFEI
jgi:putative hydrolase of the HAD superfamily